MKKSNILKGGKSKSLLRRNAEAAQAGGSLGEEPKRSTSSKGKKSGGDDPSGSPQISTKVSGGRSSDPTEPSSRVRVRETSPAQLDEHSAPSHDHEIPVDFEEGEEVEFQDEEQEHSEPEGAAVFTSVGRSRGKARKSQSKTKVTFANADWELECPAQQAQMLADEEAEIVTDNENARNANFFADRAAVIVQSTAAVQLEELTPACTRKFEEYCRMLAAGLRRVEWTTLVPPAILRVILASLRRGNPQALYEANHADGGSRCGATSRDQVGPGLHT